MNGLPNKWSVKHQFVAQRNHQALLGLDHTIRSLALKLGAEKQEAEEYVLEGRRVFTAENAVPVARDQNGDTVLGPEGLPLTPEEWLTARMNR